jgi:hypothetical protein
MIKNMIQYNNSWTKFRMIVEKKVKGRCKLNKKNWKRLKEYHFEQFIDTCSNSMYFVLRLKMWKFLPKRRSFGEQEIHYSPKPGAIRTIPCSHQKI